MPAASRDCFCLQASRRPRAQADAKYPQSAGWATYIPCQHDVPLCNSAPAGCRTFSKHCVSIWRVPLGGLPPFWATHRLHHTRVVPNSVLALSCLLFNSLVSPFACFLLSSSRLFLVAQSVRAGPRREAWVLPYIYGLHMCCTEVLYCPYMYIMQHTEFNDGNPASFITIYGYLVTNTKDEAILSQSPQSCYTEIE